MNKFLVVSGSDLNLPETHKTATGGSGGDVLDNVDKKLNALAADLKVEVKCAQFNDVGAMVDCLQKAPESFVGVIINAGAWAHDSYALRGVIDALPLPCVEVFLSDSRPPSVLAPVCVGVIGGFGVKSYLLALQALAHLAETR